MPDSTLSAVAKPTWQQRLLFGQEPSPELAAILLVYFVQGILGLSRLAVSFFLKDDLGLSPAQVSALTGIAALPWMIKPAFGLLSDGFPLGGYRRRPYLIAAGLLGSIAWLGLGTVVHSPAMATLAIALSSLSVALSDVIVDSLVVERARQESRSESGSLQSLTWAVSALGGLVTAYLSGFLLQLFETRTLFLITATFPLIVCLVAGWIAEVPQTIQPGLALIREQVGQISQALRQRRIWMPTLFLFLWQVTPSADSAFFFFSTNELHFEPEFLGRVRLVTNLASLLGVWIFQRFLRGVPMRRIFGWMIVVTTLLGLTSLILVTHLNRSWGISDQWFSLGDSLILTVAGQLSFMPVLILAARLCPSGIEATLFALLMSVLNLAHFGSVELGALLTHWLGVTESQFDRLWLLVLLTNLSSLLPLPLLGLLPAEEAETAPSDAIASAAPEPLVVTQ
ncbi:folate-biopterin transporter [Synechococcus elongatus IITB7]|uniref:folate-biopterin transporter n=1 Tax=Synechococcus elongatus TaxID=32046 RepID=UPI0030D4BA08